MPTDMTAEHDGLLRAVRHIIAEAASRDRKEFLSVREAASYLGISVRAFYEMRSKRPLPVFEFGARGGAVRFRRTDLEHWAEAFRNTNQNTSRGARASPGHAGPRAGEANYWESVTDDA